MGERHVPMSQHTSWRVGGPAEYYCRPRNRDQLIACLQSVDDSVPIHFVGRGSNLLVRDGGINAALIAVQDALTDWEELGEGRIYAGAGLACALVSRRCVRNKLGPAEFFAGIPGTVGGALTMNAGAFGGETWNQVESVEVINRRGEVTVRHPDEYRIAYREVALIEPREEWFIGGTFRFTQNYDTSPEKVKALVSQRKETQPLGLPSCGSVFRNPPGDHAARLIETAGLKGHAIGGAVVSDKHANFIINTGTATATDIENLINHIQATVQREFGVRLVREVHIIGDAA